MSLNNPLPPVDFDWEGYLRLNPDLGQAGLATRDQAVRHYLEQGRNEGRLYAWETIVPNPGLADASVIVVGTSPEIEVFEDRSLVDRVQRRFRVLCINTSFHYFDNITCLFVNGRFRNLDSETLSGKTVQEIYVPFPWKSPTHTVRHYRLATSTRVYKPEISTDLNGVLPHGPTTLLDIVFPFCVFHRVRSIHLIGTEYNAVAPGRHRHDGTYVDRSIPSMNSLWERAFALRKLHAWKDFLAASRIECFALSPNSKTPFRKRALEDLLTA